jgi:hypothetical protein
MKHILGKLFAIKPGEWQVVWYFFLVTMVFSLGAAVARTIGMTLLTENLKGDILPQMYIIVDFMAMLGFIGYAKYTKKYGELKILAFLFICTIIFSIISQFLIFIDRNWVYGFFFVGYSFLFIVTFVHIGSLVATYFTSVQIKRVTAFIGAGFPIGGVLGGGLVVYCLNFAELEHLIFLHGLACLSGLWVLKLIKNNLSPVRAAIVKPEIISQEEKTFRQEVNHVFNYIIYHKLMISMTIVLILFVISSKFLEYQYQGIIYPEALPDSKSRAKFLGTYEIFANLALLLIQLFFTSRLIMRLGVGASNILHPILMALVSLGLLFNFGFIAGFFAQFVNQEMRSGLRNPTNNLLFNAIPPNMWGTTKAFLNGIIFPLSTFIASILLIVLKNNVSYDQLIFILPLIAFVLSVLAIIFTFPLWRSYNEGVFGLLNNNIFENRTSIGDGNVINHLLEAKLNSSNAQNIITALGMIRIQKLNVFIHHIGRILRNSDNAMVKRECIETLITMPQSDMVMTHLVNGLKSEYNPQIIALILKNLKSYELNDAKLINKISKLLLHPNHEVFAEASLCLYQSNIYDFKHNIEKQVLHRLKLPYEHATYIYTLGEFKQVNNSKAIALYLESNKLDLRLASLKALIKIFSSNNTGLDSYQDYFIKSLSSPSNEIQIAALQAIRECNESPTDWSPIINLLGSKDYNIVQETTELLRLSSDCLPSLINQVFNKDISVDERFEILSLVYHKLNKKQLNILEQNALGFLKDFIYIMGIFRLYQLHTPKSKISQLVDKKLLELADDNLLNVLTIITYFSNSDREFFQRISRGLQSKNRANQGNALEVLDNVSENNLSSKILEYFAEHNTDINGITAIYKKLFNEDLNLTKQNYIEHLFSIKNDLLNACLRYVEVKDKSDKIQIFNLDDASYNTHILLGVINAKYVK